MIFDGKHSHTYWTSDMLAELRKYSYGVKIKDIAKSLGLGDECVSRKIRELGITAPVRITKQPYAIQYVKKHYSTTSNKNIAEVLGCHERDVVAIAQREGIRKDHEYQRQVWLNNAKHACECNRKKSNPKKTTSNEKEK